MPSIEGVKRVLQLHGQGVYTLRELLPLIAEHLPEDQLSQVKASVPAEIWNNFAMWVRDYPTEGGIQIRDGVRLPVERIMWLKCHVR